MNRKKLIYQIIIIFSVFLIYGNTLVNDYSIDDNLVTWMNPRVQKGIEGIADIFTNSYYETYDLKFGYRPIVQFSFALEYEVFGKSPFVGHLVNLLLYCFTGLLLFRILRRLFNEERILLSFFVTVLFLVHPLHTEVVASLKNREEILSCLFGLITLWYIIKYLERKKIYFTIFAVFSFVVAYLSKESALVFVMIIPVSIFFFTKEKISTSIVIFLILYLVIRLIRNAINQYIPSENQPLYFENPLHFNEDIFIRIGTGFITMLEYLKLLIYPHPLGYYYGYDMVPVESILSTRAIVSLIIHMGLVLFVIFGFRKKKIISYGIIVYLSGVLLFSNLIVPINGIIGERLVYTASLGFSVVLGYLIFRLYENRKRRILAFIILGLILIPYTFKTITRNSNWKNDKVLYEHDIKYLNNSAKANGVFATKLLFDLAGDPNALENKAAIKKSLKHFNRSIEIYDGYYSSYTNIAYIYSMFYKDYDKALSYLDKALMLKPDYAEANFYKGYCYEMKGEFEVSIKYYEKAIDYKPDYFEALSKLANWSNKMGDFHKAVELNKKMILIDPDSELPFINVGNYFFLRQDTLHALKYWSISYEKNPSNYYMLLNLVNLNKQIGDMEKYNFYNQKLTDFKNSNPEKQIR